MSRTETDHSVGLAGRVAAALRLVATLRTGHINVNTGFLNGLAMDLLTATPDELEALREDPEILALVASAEQTAEQQMALDRMKNTEE